MMSRHAPIYFGQIRKNVSSVRLVKLDFFNVIASFWEPGQQYASGDYVRPSKATGFSYECTTPGQSSSREPRWPKTVAATVADGGAVWTARAAGSNGANALTSPSVSVSPSTLTAGPPSVVDGGSDDSSIEFTLSAGTENVRHKVTVTVTAGSETLVGYFHVEVDD